MSNILNSMSPSYLINMLLVYLFALLATAIHELGHAACIKLVGLNIERIRIGLPTLFKIGKFEFGLIPGGATKPLNQNILENDEHQNAEILLITVGGMLGQFLFDVILLPFIKANWAQGLMLVNTIMLLVNLVPLRQKVGGCSDGYKALLILKATLKKEKVLKMS